MKEKVWTVLRWVVVKMNPEIWNKSDYFMS